VLKELKVPPPELRKPRMDTITQVLRSNGVEGEDKKDGQKGKKGIFYNLLENRGLVPENQNANENSKKSLLIRKKGRSTTMLKKLEKSLFTIEKVDPTAARNESILLPHSSNKVIAGVNRSSVLSPLKPRGTTIHPSKPSRATVIRPSIMPDVLTSVVEDRSQLSPNFKQSNRASVINQILSPGKKSLILPSSRLPTIDRPSSSPPPVGTTGARRSQSAPLPKEPADENIDLLALQPSSKSHARKSTLLFGKPNENAAVLGSNDKNLSVPTPEPQMSTKPPSRKTKKTILNREELAIELIQSRKVSRIPAPNMTGAAAAAAAGDDNVTEKCVSAQPRLTKRRSESRESKIL
jgi:hypothetical protein